MNTKIVSIILSCLFLSCIDGPGTTNVLEKKGYSNIMITGYKPFGCGFMWDKNYITRTGFKAIKDNKEVEGCVCQGMFGTTVKVYK